MVCGQGPSAEGHLIMPDVLPGCKRSHRGTRWEWMFYTGGVQVIPISRKFPHTVSELLQVVLSMEQEWCDRNQLSTHPQKFQHRGQHFMQPGH